MTAKFTENDSFAHSNSITNSFRRSHNCVDITSISPQYLVLEVPPMLAIGLQFAIRPLILTLQGKIVHGGNFMPKKKAKKKKKH